MTKPLYDPTLWKAYNTKEALTRWLALPDKHRIPATQRELAEVLGITQERLSRIKQEAGFFEEVDKYRRLFSRNSLLRSFLPSLTRPPRRGIPEPKNSFCNMLRIGKKQPAKSKIYMSGGNSFSCFPPRNILSFLALFRRKKR